MFALINKSHIPYPLDFEIIDPNVSLKSRAWFKSQCCCNLKSTLRLLLNSQLTKGTSVIARLPFC